MSQYAIAILQPQSQLTTINFKSNTKFIYAPKVYKLYYCRNAPITTEANDSTSRVTLFCSISQQYTEKQKNQSLSTLLKQ
jgi:hypothetical protein